MKTVNQILITVILLAIIVVGVFFGLQRMRANREKIRQAVFLTNGQVYFGYVSCENCRTVKIKNIYYLQVQDLQPPKDEKQQQPQLSLVKLGNELHGPKDLMRINREHILFIEDMRDDSKVNGAIEDYIKNGNKAPTPAATSTP